MKKNWDKILLADALVYVIGGDWGKEPSFASQDEDYTIAKVIRGTEIRNWEKEFGSTAVERAIKNSNLQNRRLQDGDLIIEISGGGPTQSVGRTVLIDEAVLSKFEPPLVCTNFFRLLRFSSLHDPRFLNYFFDYEYGKGTFEKYQTSTTNLRNLQFTTLSKELEVPLPPLAEQRRIVAKLDASLERLRAAEVALEAVPALLEDFRRAVLHWAVTGRLTEAWRGENGEVLSAGNELKEFSIKVLKDDALPPGWARADLGNYLENYDAARSPISEVDRRNRRGDYPYYGASGIIDSIDGFTHDGDFILIGEDGANLVTRSKPIAFFAKGKIWVNNHAHVLACKGDYPNNYVIHYINLIDLKPYVTGSAQPKLSQKSMNKIPIPIPPLREQLLIVEIIEQLFRFEEKIRGYIQDAKQELHTLRQTLHALAFRGELLTAAELAEVQAEADYEPAGVLLERIKAEKARVEGEMKGLKARASISKTKKSSMKKTEDLQAVIADKFKSKPFTFDELRQALEPVSYEDLKGELFAILSEDAGEGQVSLFDKILKINMRFNELIGKIEFTIKDK
jgi:type I restriction enzyme S subunit